MNLAFYPSPLGRILLLEEDNALTGVYFEGQKYYPSLSPALCQSNTDVLLRASAWLDGYFQGLNPALPPVYLSPRGSDFRQRVWQELMRIPYGETISYGELAQRLDSSPRAVGNAVGHNPISLFIPCHRVVGAGGKLSGYAGGIEKKQYLLILESNTSI